MAVCRFAPAKRRGPFQPHWKDLANSNPFVTPDRLTDNAQFG